MRTLVMIAGGCALLAGPALAQLPTPAPSAAAPNVAPPASVNVPVKPVGGAVQKGGQAVVVGSGAHGGGPAPVVAGAVPQSRPFTEGVTDGGTKVGKGMKSTGSNIERGGVTVSPKGAKAGVEAAPEGLKTQAKRAAAIPNQ